MINERPACCTELPTPVRTRGRVSGTVHVGSQLPRPFLPRQRDTSLTLFALLQPFAPLPLQLYHPQQLVKGMVSGNHLQGRNEASTHGPYLALAVSDSSLCMRSTGTVGPLALGSHLPA